MKFALDSVVNFKRKDLKDFFPAILNNTKFQDFLKLCFDSGNSMEQQSVTLNSLKNIPRVGGMSTQKILLDQRLA